MPPSEPSRIFISYARRDGAKLAQRLQKDLEDSGFDTWLDIQRIKGGAVWSIEIEREVDTRQVTLALMSPGSSSSEICRAEQLRALDKGHRVIPVLAVKGADRPLYLYARQFRDFTNDGDYPGRITELLADIRGDATATLPDAYRNTRVTYLTVPPRVANYLERPEALRSLRDVLFAEDDRQPIPLTALAGMGGIGKTVLAKAITDDNVVQRAFPDGIVWITAGKEHKRDFIEEMREVAKALGDDLSSYDTALACENQYRITIANKAALIVVDDVWSIDDIRPLLAESPRSRFLFTTRDASIGRFVGAHEHRADLLDQKQSRELLASWANLAVAELPAVADELIAECGRLPLALSVVGAMVHGTDAQFWKDTLDLLRNADLSTIEDQLPAGQHSFFTAVEVSFLSLKPDMQVRYKVLAVLLKDMAATLPIVQVLWKVNEAEARRTSRLFVDRSLAQPAGAGGPGESIRLHDLQLDYVRAQCRDKEALGLIHGAMRLSENAIAGDPYQFASQLVGRLLPYQGVPTIGQFADTVGEGTRTPWLRPLQPALNPPGTSLIRTLAGHRRGVTGVALSGDGAIAVSASFDHTLKVWDVSSGRELRTLTGHSEGIRGVALSADGGIAVSASEDDTLKVWEVGSGHELRTLVGHSLFVYGVALSGNGRIAVSASLDKTLKVWEIASGRELRTLAGHTGGVNDVALSEDGQLAVSASDDKTLKVWETASGRELRTLAGHTGGVNGVALIGNERIAVSASSDQTLKVWEVDSGRELRAFKGHSGRVFGVAVSGTGRMAVSASDDQSLKVWEIESGREMRTLAGHTGGVSSVALSGDDQIAVSASFDGTLNVWEMVSGRETATLARHAGGVRGVALSGDGQIAVSASSDKKLKVWKVENGRELRTLAGHTDGVSCVALSGDGRIAVSASYDTTLKIWQVESGRELRTLLGHRGYVYCVAISEDGRLAVSASSDTTLKVWQVESGRELRTLKGHSGAVSGVALSADGQLAVSASWDQSLKVWEIESGREMRELVGHYGGVYDVALRRDAQLAVSGSSDFTVKVWDVESGRELRTMEGHTNVVSAVALSGDGRLAVSASSDNTLKVWEVASGALVASFTCDGSPCCCAFADGRRLVVAGDTGGRLYFLRLEEPKPKP
jgi:WD40 repeat protein